MKNFIFLNMPGRPTFFRISRPLRICRDGSPLRICRDGSLGHIQIQTPIPNELDQAHAFNKGAGPHLQMRYQPLLQLRWANPRPAATESLLLDKRAISHLHRAET